MTHHLKPHIHRVRGLSAAGLAEKQEVEVAQVAIGAGIYDKMKFSMNNLSQTDIAR